MACHGVRLERHPLGDESRCHGVAIRYPSLFCALYAADGTIWLQAGNQIWNASQIDSVTQERDDLRQATYSVRLRDGRRESVKLAFPPAVVAHRLLDPTYDEIDSWGDDIMKTLAYVAADGWRSESEDVQSWVQRVRAKWEPGFKRIS